jgi:hypothetical protein
VRVTARMTQCLVSKAAPFKPLLSPGGGASLVGTCLTCSRLKQVLIKLVLVLLGYTFEAWAYGATQEACRKHACLAVCFIQRILRFTCVLCSHLTRTDMLSANAGASEIFGFDSDHPYRVWTTGLKNVGLKKPPAIFLASVLSSAWRCFLCIGVCHWTPVQSNPQIVGYFWTSVQSNPQIVLASKAN